MVQKRKLKQSKDKTFSTSLGKIRSRLAVVNAILILAALGFNGSKIGYSVAGAYLVLSLFCWLVPFLQHLVVHSLRFLMLGIDVTITGYMIALTGGSASDLYPFLFIPVLIAVLRCRYPGIIGWSSLMALILTAGAWYAGTLSLRLLLFKIFYLYLAGILGGYLTHQTFSVSEEISKRLTRWNIDLQRLNNFSQEVTGSSDLEEIFTRITSTVRQSSSAEMVAIMMFDDEILKIYDSIGWEEDWVEGYNHNPLNKHSLTLAPIIVFKQPLLCPDIKKHPELTKTFKGISVASLFAFPLVITGEVAGALVITSQTTRNLPEQDTQILVSIANQASIAIQNVVNLSEEKRKADTDGLTGLYNRRYFNEQIEVLMQRTQQQGISLSLIMIDVDNFKKYNDTYGHPAGDQLLKAMSETISDVVRDQDIVARYGGEEIVIILKDTNNKLAMHIAERARLAVQNMPAGALKCSITISGGVATYPDHARDRVSLLEYADKSLYHAKDTGKNRVCCGFKD